MKCQLRTAMHESGHVVCNLYFGHTFKFVELLRPSELRATDLFPQYDLACGEFVAGRVHSDGKERRSAYESVVVTMGGVAGERVNRKYVKHLTFIDLLRGAEADYRHAKEIMPSSDISDMWLDVCFNARTKEAAIDSALQKAHHIVRHYRETHAAIANALLERRRLSYEECFELWSAGEATAVNRVSQRLLIDVVV